MGMRQRDVGHLRLGVVVTACLILFSARSGRGEEDPGEPALPRPVLVAARGHGSPVSAVALSPDGRFVLTGSHDQSAILWERETGREVRRFRGTSGRFTALAFGADGNSVAGITEDPVSRDRTACLWTAASAEEARRIEMPGDTVARSALSADGSRVLWCRKDGDVHVQDLTTGREVIRLSGEDTLSEVTTVRGGRHVLGCTQAGSIRIWDAGTGALAHSFSGPEQGVTSVALSTDGRFVVTASRADQSIRLWEVSIGEEVRRFEGFEGSGSWEESPIPMTVAFSPDGRTVLAGWDVIGMRDDGGGPYSISTGGGAGLWDRSTGRRIRSLGGRGSEGHAVCVSAVAFSIDGRYALTGSHDETACLWDVETGRRVRRYGGAVRGFRELSCSRAGRCLFLACFDGTVRYWRVDEGSEVSYYGYDRQRAAVSFAVSQDLGCLLMGSIVDRRVDLWDLQTNTVRHGLRHRNVSCVALDESGRFAATGCPWGIVRTWDTATGEAVGRLDLPHGDRIASVALSSGGQRILVGSTRSGASVWSRDDGRKILDLSAGPLDVDPSSTEEYVDVSCAVFSPDERRIAASVRLPDSGRWGVVLWDARTGGEIRRMDTSLAPDCAIHSVAFAAHGNSLVAGLEDGTARVWACETGREVMCLEGHADAVLDAAFAHKGHTLLTASTDGTARLWRAATGKELCSLISLTDGNWAVVAPDGRFDAKDLEALEGLNWVLPDDPMRALPIEIFMREYYEPQLLPRLLLKRPFRRIRALRDLNRAQPEVHIVAVASEPDRTDTVSVTVVVEGTELDVGPAAGRVAVHSGAKDLRVFRGGRLVGWMDGPLELEDGACRTTLTGIRLPESDAGREVEFSAYAFNVDGVKSATTRATHRVPESLDTPERTAYLIAFGVDDSDVDAWDLNYAAADARAYVEVLTERIPHLVPVLLTSEKAVEDGRVVRTVDHARKQDLETVFGLLAGRAVDEAARERIPGASRIRMVRPDDLVLIAISTHGVTGDAGEFYLLPSDVEPAGADETWHRSLISADELSRWLRPIDAELAMIVDACQSAASVDREGFKPGPMGSRGLGQLAWNKRMRILAASQATASAHESSAVRHGLLTYALTKFGLEAGKSDFHPQDGTITLGEWLRYGADEGVKAVAEGIAAGTIRGVARRGPLQSGAPPQPRHLVQQPALFDFARDDIRETVLQRRKP